MPKENKTPNFLVKILIGGISVLIAEFFYTRRLYRYLDNRFSASRVIDFNKYYDQAFDDYIDFASYHYHFRIVFIGNQCLCDLDCRLHHSGFFCRWILVGIAICDRSQYHQFAVWKQHGLRRLRYFDLPA